MLTKGLELINLISQMHWDSGGSRISRGESANSGEGGALT